MMVDGKLIDIYLVQVGEREKRFKSWNGALSYATYMRSLGHPLVHLSTINRWN